MEMQITADFSVLTAEQREHLAGFILTFPPIPVELKVPGHTVRLRVETEDDPAAAFGAQEAIAQPDVPIAQAGPSVVIPPPPATVLPATQAQIPASVVARATVEIDKHGLPWDGRIHASTKAKNADGSWRTKRGLGDAVLAEVEAELKALMMIPSAGPQLVPTPPPPAAAVPPPPGGANQLDAFIGLMGRASAAMQAKKITEDEIKKCCGTIDSSLVALPLLANRLDLVPTVAALIDGIIAGRSA